MKRKKQREHEKKDSGPKLAPESYETISSTKQTTEPERDSKPKKTRFITAAGVGVLIAATVAIIYFLQLRVMINQLAQMRLDQRPWVSITVEKIPIAENQPIAVAVHVVNIGKTPARSIDISTAVEQIDSDKTPQSFEPCYPGCPPHVKLTTGALFPQNPMVFQTGLLSPLKEPPREQMPMPPQIILSHDDYTKLMSGKAYLATYGVAVYYDSVGTQHWTKFCSWTVFTSGPFNSKLCSDYNQTDTNH